MTSIFDIFAKRICAAAMAATMAAAMAVAMAVAAVLMAVLLAMAAPAAAWADATLVLDTSVEDKCEVKLTVSDGQTYYQITYPDDSSMDETPVAYDGVLTISTGGEVAKAGLKVESGSHVIVLDDAKLHGDSMSGIALTSGTSLDVTLMGENEAKGSYMSCGIDLPSGATLTFTAESTGSIVCAAEDNGGANNRGRPGIGNVEAMGSLVVNGGYIEAHPAYGKAGNGYNNAIKGNAIGTMKNEQNGTTGSGGSVTITGGTVCAIGRSDIPAIGGFINRTRGTFSMTSGRLIVDSNGGSGVVASGASSITNAYFSGTFTGATAVSNSLINGTVSGRSYEGEVVGSYEFTHEPPYDSMADGLFELGHVVTLGEGETLSIAEGCAVKPEGLNVTGLAGAVLKVDGVFVYDGAFPSTGLTVLGSGSMTKEKPTPLLSVTQPDEAFAYMGKPLSADDIAYSYNGNGKVSLSVAPVAVGAYTVKLMAAETGLCNAVESAAFEVRIVKGTPAITWPQVTLAEGQSLAEAVLGGKAMLGDLEIEGTFVWKDGTAKPTLADSGATAYSLTWVPADGANLNEVSNENVTVKVVAAPSDGEGEGGGGDNASAAKKPVANNGADSTLAATGDHFAALIALFALMAFAAAALALATRRV